MSFNNEAERLADALTEYGEAFDDGPGMFAEAAALLRSQAAKLARREVDAGRYQWLRERLLAADFAWGDPPCQVLVFSWPSNVAVGGDCDQNIDAARAAAPTEGAQS